MLKFYNKLEIVMAGIFMSFEILVEYDSCYSKEIYFLCFLIKNKYLNIAGNKS